MQEFADTELLRQFAENDSEPAFAALVQRHVNLVYSAAIRKTGNPHAAEEITQAVFIILAKKAKTLRRETMLSGWLYQTTRLTAANFLRGEIRRSHREQEAYMQSLSNETETWTQIEPLLEDAMGRLNEKERNAIVLRFFEGKSFQEIGAAFGGSENAAKKRVIHGLEKLRNIFAKRGVSSTTGILAGTISTNSIQAAPIGLAKTISAVALTKGAAVSTSTLTLTKGALKIMAWTKIKTAAVVGVAVIFAAGTTTMAIHHAHLRRANEPLLENAWANKGLATPEAAFQTSLWAMSKGDIKTLTASYTPGFQSAFMETAGKGKSAAEISALLVQIAGMIGDFQVVSIENTASDELILHFRSARMGAASVPMKKIGNEWKMNGNITSDERANKTPLH